MGGFIATCVDKEYRNGKVEIIQILGVALDSLERKARGKNGEMEQGAEKICEKDNNGEECRGAEGNSEKTDGEKRHASEEGVAEGGCKVGVMEQIRREKAKLKKSSFCMLGGRRDSDIFFIRNDSDYSEISLYNEIVSHTIRAHYIRRLIPVKSIFTLSPENIARETEKLRGCFQSEDTFRISLNKRLGSHIGSEHLISLVAEKLPYKVDLKNPKKVVMVEIVKDLVGIGVLRPCKGNYNLTRSPDIQKDID